MKKSGITIAGRYRLLEIIGEGRQGVVYRAHDDRLDRNVAVRLLPATTDQRTVTAFGRAAEHASELDHPHIGKVIEHGVDRRSRTHYVVAEFVDGVDLATLLASAGRLALEDALHVGLESTKALQAAHEVGIFHGDLRPGNILIGRDGNVLVTDFGLAPEPAQAYASPEQILHEPITSASDVYALGVVVYEAITGQPPFGGSSSGVVASARPGIPASRPSAVSPGLPSEIDPVVLGAIAREPWDRYRSAAEFGAALERYRILHLGTIGTTGDGLQRAIAVAEAARSQRRWQHPPASVDLSAQDRRAAKLVGRRVTGHHPRAISPRAVALPVGLVAIALLILPWAFGGSTIEGEVRSATGVPGTPMPSAFAVDATSQPPAGDSGRQDPTPAPSTAVSASPAPAPSANNSPIASTGDPVDTVTRFYDLVERGRFEDAARLWTARQRDEHPPEKAINEQFAATTRIEIVRVETSSMNFSNDAAFVIVDLTEYRSSGPPRRLVGTWRVVLSPSGWLMDDLHL